MADSQATVAWPRYGQADDGAPPHWNQSGTSEELPPPTPPPNP
jgi:hypothetical protein